MSADAAARVMTLAPGDLDEATRLLAAACPFDNADRVAGEKLFGPATGHDAHTLGIMTRDRLGGPGEHLAAVATVSGPWIRLLAVHPDHRGHGLGTTLLRAAEDAAVAAAGTAGPVVVRLMDQPGNYLAPGIDSRNQATIDWLARRGYAVRGHNTNLLVDVRTNPRVSAARAQDLARACAGYELRRARQGQVDGAALHALAASFLPSWAFAAARSLAGDGAGSVPGVHVAMHRGSGDMVAFAAYDGNNRGLGWFGPAGTLDAHRGRGLGAALLLACLVDVAAAGHHTCEIAWIGPRDFYARVAGIAGERRFAVMRKEITPS